MENNNYNISAYTFWESFTKSAENIQKRFKRAYQAFFEEPPRDLPPIQPPVSQLIVYPEEEMQIENEEEHLFEPSVSQDFEPPTKKRKLVENQKLLSEIQEIIADFLQKKKSEKLISGSDKLIRIGTGGGNAKDKDEENFYPTAFKFLILFANGSNSRQGYRIAQTEDEIKRSIIAFFTTDNKPDFLLKKEFLKSGQKIKKNIKQRYVETLFRKRKNNLDETIKTQNNISEKSLVELLYGETIYKKFLHGQNDFPKIYYWNYDSTQGLFFSKNTSDENKIFDTLKNLPLHLSGVHGVTKQLQSIQFNSITKARQPIESDDLKDQYLLTVDEYITKHQPLEPQRISRSIK